MLVGEAAVLATYFFSRISYLWFNVIGCVVVIVTSLAVSAAISATPARRRRE